ncbi:MAG: serine/threonine protein kinase [Myxococcales bacterium]|nr:serine/threonine protein kinase [Myxococcales bacterium]
MFDLPIRIGRWTIDRLIGRGGMASVLLGIDDAVPEGEIGHLAAIKWLHSASPRIRARFAREVRVLRALSHPGIVRVIEAGEQDGRPWVALQFVDGPDLAQHALTLRKRPSAERAARARSYAVDLCEALAVIHDAGLVHRDVKPANVLLAPNGHVVLTDFGVVAELASDEPVTQSGTLVGTAAWAAPEQLSDGDVDGRTDQYGLGATLYLLLTGQRPVEATDAAEIFRQVISGKIRAPANVDPTVPADLEAFVLRLLNARPEDRFPDMRAALASLGPAEVAGNALSGRQPAIDALARVLDTVAAGRGLLVEVRGAPLSGRAWLAGVARASGTRREIRVVTADDPLTLDAACDRLSAGEALLVLTSDPRGRVVDETIRLDPLSIADVRRSTHALAPGTQGLALVADQLHRWSGGNAGLFLALVAATRSGDAIVLGPAPPAVYTGGLLAGLDLDALTVAGALAAVPGAIDQDLVARIAQVSPQDSLDELARRGVAVRSEGEHWRLVAEALRLPILSSVPDADALLDRAAASLSPDETDDADPVLEQASRLERAGEGKQALTLLLSQPATLPRQLLVGRLEWCAGHLGPARAAFEGVLAGAPGGVLRARAAIGAGATALHLGNLQIALDRFSQAVTEAGIPGNAGAARGHLVLACVNLAEARSLAGEAAMAIREAHRALDIATAERDRALECLAKRVLGRVQMDAGHLTEATATLADASALARATDLREERLIAHVLRADLGLRISALEAAAVQDRAARPSILKTAATGAQDRLLPLLGVIGSGPDPEGWRPLTRAVYARVVARVGDAGGLRRWTVEAERLCEGVGVPGRVRVQIALADAWLEGPDGCRTEGERRRAEVDHWSRELGFLGV